MSVYWLLFVVGRSENFRGYFLMFWVFCRFVSCCICVFGILKVKWCLVCSLCVIIIGICVWLCVRVKGLNLVSFLVLIVVLRLLVWFVIKMFLELMRNWFLIVFVIFSMKLCIMKVLLFIVNIGVFVELVISGFW